jgi:aspartyl-tRNA synthetase
VRGRIHYSREKGKLCFLILREKFATVQASLFINDNISKGMVNYASKIPKESIVEVKAKVLKTKKDIESCSQSKVEL